MGKILRYIVLIAVAGTFSFSSYSQSRAVIAELKNKLSYAAIDSTKATILNQLCWNYRYLNPDSAYLYGEQALLIYRKTDNFAGQSDILNKMGVAKRNMGDYPAALDCYFKALNISSDHNLLRELAYANNNIGDIYHRLENYTEAIVYVDKALKHFAEVNDSVGIAYAYNRKGEAYKGAKEWKMALESLYKAQNIRNKLSNKDMEAATWINIANCYFELHMLDSALIGYNKSIELLYDINEYERPSAHLGLGKYYFAIGNFYKAIENLNLAVEYSRKSKYPLIETEAYEYLEKIYLGRNKIGKAYNYLKLASNLKALIEKEESIKRITKYEMEFAFKRQNELKEIEDLKQKAIFESDLLKQKLISYALIFMMLFVGIGIMLVYRNFRFVKRTNAALYKINVELKEKELAIELQNIKLQEVNATKDKFFGIIAHDLINPFNGILGFSDLVIDSIKNNEPEAGMYAGLLKKSADNGFKLLQNLLLWSRSQTGKITFVPEQLQVNDIISKALDTVKSSATLKQITLATSEIAEATVFADANMLETVLRNLATNAIKYTPVGGTVTISMAKNHNETVFTVTDTGVGISEKLINKLFDVSEKISTPGTNKEPGTGLGLILCKEFVEKHGGKIWAESELKKGSSFFFTIPNQVATN